MSKISFCYPTSILYIIGKMDTASVIGIVVILIGLLLVAWLIWYLVKKETGEQEPPPDEGGEGGEHEDDEGGEEEEHEGQAMYYCNANNEPQRFLVDENNTLYTSTDLPDTTAATFFYDYLPNEINPPLFQIVHKQSGECVKGDVPNRVWIGQCDAEDPAQVWYSGHSNYGGNSIRRDINGKSQCITGAGNNQNALFAVCNQEKSTQAIFWSEPGTWPPPGACAS